ncbi:hypothetical protein O9H85_04720 [Paenibacillus filicis]|uniref:Uncharacterized protein n=1 Tax=Paenibacillus gyeongsangnamensis TaxID=3388067 RepID=A0ABT4Q4V5_9BACL|nr:hypothetical protein [Paenibacillus filicis]MCZ8511735.1 hypothetical protein [Paenibacillus filicis]
MKFKVCVNNLDLHGHFKKKGIHQEFSQNENLICEFFPETEDIICQDDFELEEFHCLGYCYWCQLGPIAIVNDNLLTKNKN